MADIWFISDTHFGHANILKFLDGEGKNIRPFQSLEEMDEHMIARWNERVKVQDKVYHLGDVALNNNVLPRVMPRLQGHKRLIVGNHDKLVPDLLRWFEKTELWTGGKFKQYNFVGSHIPLREDQLRKIEYNVHGHIHSNKSPSPQHLNMCVEVNGYSPVHLDEIRKITGK